MFFGAGQKPLGMRQKFLSIGQIVRKASLKQVGFL